MTYINTVNHKLKATTDFGSKNEAEVREVIAYMLNANQAVTKDMTPYVALVEFDLNNVTHYAAVSLSRNACHSFDGMDVDYEIGEALGAWKLGLPTGAEVVDLETFTNETEYVAPAFDPNHTKYNPTSVGYRLR